MYQIHSCFNPKVAWQVSDNILDNPFPFLSHWNCS